MNQDAVYIFVKELNTQYIGPVLVFLLLFTGIFLLSVFVLFRAIIGAR